MTDAATDLPLQAKLAAAQPAVQAKPWQSEALLSKPLYLFDLPAPLLQSLKLRSIDGVREDERAATGASATVTESSGQSSTKPSSNGLSACAVCPGSPSSFRSAAEVRAHLRSDWHRYNVGLSKRGRAEDTLNEEAFDAVVKQLSSSDEGSSDEQKSARSVPIDTVSTLLSRLRLRTTAEATTTTDDSSADEGGERGGASTVALEAHLWFVTRPDAQVQLAQTQLGVVRQVFPDADGDGVVPPDWHAHALARLQPGPLNPSLVKSAKRLKGASAAAEAANMLGGVVFVDSSGEVGAIEEESGSEGEEEGTDARQGEDDASSVAATTLSSNPTAWKPMRTWTILLMGGGDFAAIIVALNPYDYVISKRKGTSERQLLIVARKQFHRYTTRRKQGGAQSAQDSSGKFAKSAGAQLRRYGEQQLSLEIRELLDRPAWRQAIQSSERVWVRAGLRSARGTLWSWAASAPSGSTESPLEEMRKRDLVRTLPLATRKPTVGECLRCFAELTRVRVRHETKEEMAARDAAYRAQLEGSAQAKQLRRQKQKERLQREVDAKQQQQQQQTAKKRAAVKLSPLEQLRRERFVRLIDMLRKGRLDNVVKHLDKYETELLQQHGWDARADAAAAADEPDDIDEAMELARKRINAPLPSWWRFLDARDKGALLQGPADGLATQFANLTARQRLVPSTLLQAAAEGGHANVVQHLLLERRSDPTLSVGPPPHAEAAEAADAAHSDIEAALATFPHRTAYDLCPSRDARDVFRRVMAAPPSWCANVDWQGMERGGARVAKAALTEEMQEARAKEDLVRDKRHTMRERARMREEAEAKARAHTITDEDRLHAATMAAKTTTTAEQAGSSNANRLGGSNQAPRALNKQRDESAGLTPEMRARIEREKRARAAEARFKALQGGSQQ